MINRKCNCCKNIACLSLNIGPLSYHLCADCYAFYQTTLSKMKGLKSYPIND